MADRLLSPVMDAQEAPRAKVVVIGGGTGTFTVLSGLRDLPLDLTAIVAMSDDGGSTGRLRDEFGVLPPGDIRQCLVALSEADVTMRTLINYRYDHGDLKGHSFGNIFISTMETITGDLDHALETIGDIMKIRGRVVPVTLTKVRLSAKLKNGKVLDGEHAIDDYQLVSRFGIERISLTPRPKANPKALRAIKDADIIVVGPGSFYTSLIPNFLVPGVGKALAASKAKKIYVANLMNKHGHTDDFLVSDYLDYLERLIGKRRVFTHVVYNSKIPSRALLRRYADEGEPVRATDHCRKGRVFIATNLLRDELHKKDRGDTLARTLIRHDPKKLAKAISSIIAT
jgi:uncharacterized cofD-like protein